MRSNWCLIAGVLVGLAGCQSYSFDPDAVAEIPPANRSHPDHYQVLGYQPPVEQADVGPVVIEVSGMSVDPSLPPAPWR